MSEQTLMAVIQLMTQLLGDGAVSTDNKKVANTILSKALAIAEANISKVYSHVVSNLTLAV